MARKKKNRRLKTKIAVIIIFSFFLITAFGLLGFVYLSKNLPNPAQFNTRKITQSTKIYDRAGQVLLYEIHGEEKRTVISFEQIPEYVKQTTLVIEDNNFYQHQAFDWRALIRALFNNIWRGGVVQGGSTITQQLVKNAFLTQERTINRKLKELILAIQIERHFTKDEIFNFYLNQIPYGANAYGIEAASQTYFNKSAKDLNLAEAALLAGLPKAPTYYSPWGNHTDELEQRKNYILQRMLDLGFIDQEEKDRAQKTKLAFAPQTTTIKAPHFVLMVREYLNNKYGERFVENSGLKVITTLDWPMQEIAEKSVLEGVKRNEKLYRGKNASLVAQDAKTGQILALVGSRDYFDETIDGNFNVAVQGLRQPGSAIKPFTYLTAFTKGYTPDTVVFDVPTEFTANNPDCPIIPKPETNQPANKEEEKKCYHPENFDGRFRGPVTLREGLAQSINIPSVKVLYLAGIEDVLNTAHQFGITTLKERSRYGLSLVLGGGEVKLIDLVGAYSVFSQDGIKHQQSIILKVEDNQNNIIEEYNDLQEKVIDPQYARLINDILSDKEARSPLFSSSLNLTTLPNQEVALKTGTTNDYRDAWAMGYTPSLVVGVWAGNNDNSPMQKQGGSILAAVPIWHAFISEAIKNQNNIETFNRPDKIIAEKPILRGEKIIKNKIYFDSRNNSPATQDTPAEYIQEKEYPQIHSILYYIEKNNPQGQAPKNPENDPQFKNWEEAVLDWAKRNIFNFSAYNQEVIQQNTNLNQPAFKPVISNVQPISGVFIGEVVIISASIESIFDLKEISVYFNDELIDKKTDSLEKKYLYHYESKQQNLNPQNLIKIKVYDIFNNYNEYQAIVYQ
ncbi:MAG: PBP1A family penicillin-binding protein [Patescibacteria group bacterium]